MRLQYKKLSSANKNTSVLPWNKVNISQRAKKTNNIIETRHPYINIYIYTQKRFHTKNFIDNSCKVCTVVVKYDK